MFPRIAASALAGLALCAPAILGAQTPTVATTITFVVPVNLTQLSPEILKVRAFCSVLPSAVLVWPQSGPSPAVTDEMDVHSGQLITVFRVAIPILSTSLQDPLGKRADYACQLEGFAKGRWAIFSETASDPTWRLKLQQPSSPFLIQASFIW